MGKGKGKGKGKGEGWGLGEGEGQNKGEGQGKRVECGGWWVSKERGCGDEEEPRAGDGREQMGVGTRGV